LPPHRDRASSVGMALSGRVVQWVSPVDRPAELGRSARCTQCHAPQAMHRTMYRTPGEVVPWVSPVDHPLELGRSARRIQCHAPQAMHRTMCRAPGEVVPWVSPVDRPAELGRSERRTQCHAPEAMHRTRRPTVLQHVHPSRRVHRHMLNRPAAVATRKSTDSLGYYLR